MSYTLERFGSVMLPAYDPQIDVGTGGSVAQAVNLAGGRTYDTLGAGQAPRASTHISLRATLVASSPQQLDDEYDSLRTRRGKRDRLWRRRADESEEWCWARLLEVKATRQAHHFRHLEVELDFLMLSPVWYGQAHAQAFPLNGLTNAFTLTNGGNARVTNAVLTLTPTPSITKVTVRIVGVSEFEWAGASSATQSLVIDCGARSVRKDGADDYAYFGLTPNHRADDWLPLEPGENQVQVSLPEGQTGSIVISYCDGRE